MAFFEAHGLQLEKKDLTIEHAEIAGRMLAHVHQQLKHVPDSGYRRYGNSLEQNRMDRKADRSREKNPKT